MNKETKRKLNNSIRLLESILGKKIILEVSESSKNLSVESLNALSDSLDMVKQNINQTLSIIDNIDDSLITKLKGMESIIDASLTDVAEGIASITGMRTKEDYMDNESSLEESDEHGIEMTVDDAIKNMDNVKKITDKGVNIIIDDKKTSY